MNKPEHFFATLRRYALSFLVGAVSLLGAWNAYALHEVEFPDGDETDLLSSGRITIILNLDDNMNANITPGTGNKMPQLRLSGIRNFADTGSTPIYADYADDGYVNGDYEPNQVVFQYLIKPGDFSDGISIQSYVANGAVLHIDGLGNVSTVNIGNPDTKGPRVSTFYFTETGLPTTIHVPESRAKVGKEFSYTISCGGTIPTTGIKFLVSAHDDLDSEVSFDVTPGGSSSANSIDTLGGTYTAQMTDSGSLTLKFKPKTIVDHEVKIRIRPSGAVTESADLYLIFDSIEENIATISSVKVQNPQTYVTVGDKIDIEVTFTDNFKDSFRVSNINNNNKPFLNLNVQNSNNRSTYAVNNAMADYAVYKSHSGRKMYFEYTVKAGDFVDTLDATRFNSNGAPIDFSSSVYNPDTDYSLPKGATAGSLASQTPKTSIQTMTFSDSGAMTHTINPAADKDIQVTISLGGPAIGPQVFQITANPIAGEANSLVSMPQNTLTIPANSETGTFYFKTLDPGTQTFRLHPAKFTGTEGDLILTVNIGQSGVAPVVQITSSAATLTEGDDPSTLTVSLSKPPKEDIVVTVRSANSHRLTIVDCDPAGGSVIAGDGTETGGDYASLVFRAASTASYYILVDPVDGANEKVAVTATANKTYAEATYNVRVNNANPIFNPSMSSGEDGRWIITPSAAMASATIFWSATDPSVIDLRAPLTATVEFGDGTPPQTVSCGSNGSGSVNHTYLQANTAGYNVTVTVQDKDGGEATITGTIVVTAPATALINEYKRQETHVGQNSYKGLRGVGEGSVYDNKGSPRNVLHADYDWNIYYNPGAGSIIYLAEPETFEEFNIQEGRNQWIDSFVHVWIGNEFIGESVLDPVQHLSTAQVVIDDKTSAVTIGAVFSREHFPADGVADIDWDSLPDDWEQIVWPDALAFENGNGDYGREGNLDLDYFPACVASIDPITGAFIFVDGEKAVDYTPNGIPFINVYEVRGTHPGLNMNSANTPVVGTGVYTVETAIFPDELLTESDIPFVAPLYAETNTVPFLDVALVDAAQDAWIVDSTFPKTFKRWIAYDDAASYRKAYDVFPKDEPHYENENSNPRMPYFGTDPNNPDSDGDMCTDGYEYFFWRLAKFANGPIGERYDPTRVIYGIPLDNSEIVDAFHPLIAKNHANMDIDGDGLSNFEEMLLGTNPIHWDTDGDQMNDGWEVIWGLNPLSAGDAAGNPDGDFMAFDSEGGLRHSDVYENYGFDPRTAWIDNYALRNRSEKMSAPNTMPYTTFEEYYLAVWSIQKGFALEVSPTSRSFMTQPTPYGTRYYLKDGKVAYTMGAASESTGIQEDGSFSVPYGDQAFLVNAQEITSHGCDTDGDGMPDGWELYVSREGTQVNIWPCGTDVSHTDILTDYDEDTLTVLEECHSTELCDYYSSINTNMVANVNQGWYNKWWPTDPFNPDTDHDGLADPLEGDSTFRYQDQNLTTAELTARFGNNTMRRGHVPGGGLNPNAVDTDMDYLPDAWEYQFAGSYRDPYWEGGFCNDPETMVGVGMDGTYFDSRSSYDEVVGKDAVITNQPYIIPKVNAQGQVEGYYRNYDYDGDGLENYQEYLINAMHHFQYDKWVPNQGMGGYDIGDIFNGGFAMIASPGYWLFEQGRTGEASVWASNKGFMQMCDWSYFVDHWEYAESTIGGVAGGLEPGLTPMFTYHALRYMLPQVRTKSVGYASTDPRLADSDFDQMDDYYEMFHGLNPILGDTNEAMLGGLADLCDMGLGQDVPIVYDWATNPWMVGAAGADPDGDGIPNWEEAIAPNQPAPANHNTDPSPYWFTDLTNPNSFVNLYYTWGSIWNYWTKDGESELLTKKYEQYPDPDFMYDSLLDGIQNRPSYIYSFECNEGFDTDNDNLSDRVEINGESGGITDPQNSDRPIARKALYLDGNAAARTRSLCAFGQNALRSWTIEAWVKPENPAGGSMQVIMERPVSFIAGDHTITDRPMVRRTFRLALDENGVPFVEFNNGAADVITEQAKATGAPLPANQWTHLAAVMDGFAGQLILYVNGNRVATKPTMMIPYTGFTTSANLGMDNATYINPAWAPIVIGAADSRPSAMFDARYTYLVDGDGTVYQSQLQQNVPTLSNFFKGWIDEVRIWDGARPGGDDIDDLRTAQNGWSTIRDDFKNLKRYGFSEVLASLNESTKLLSRTLNERLLARKAQVEGELFVSDLPENVVGNTEELKTWYVKTNVAVGMSIDQYRDQVIQSIHLYGGEKKEYRIPPKLLCVYSFDTLPDPELEQVQPARFATLNNRPADYEGIPWLKDDVDNRSTVYVSDNVADTSYYFPQMIKNLVSTLPIGHLVTTGTDEEYERSGKGRIPLYQFRADSVANSKYWTRYTVGREPRDPTGMMEVNFPNNANPYGMRYETALVYEEQKHPQVFKQVTYDSADSVLFNDLVPLRNAVAQRVQLWDDPFGDMVGVNADSDGDGLSDVWELLHGLDPFDPDQNKNGIPDRWDDFDGDGLNNYAEQLAGLDPISIDSNHNGTPDYFDSPFGGLTYGELYTDNDHVLDSWESQWDESLASPFRYDEHKDRDLDGWDNWSEALKGTSLQYNSFDMASENGKTIYKTKEEYFPVPDIHFALHYKGDSVLAKKIVIHVYSDPEMNGWPDAVYEKEFSGNISREVVIETLTATYVDQYGNHIVLYTETELEHLTTEELVELVKDINEAKYEAFKNGLTSKTLDTWPMELTMTKDNLVYGHIRQGKNWFYAWIEMDNSKLPINSDTWSTWTPGEPAAIADAQYNGIDIGFDYNKVTFHLTDHPQGYVRFSLQQPSSGNATVVGFSQDKKDHTLTVRINGSPILEKTLKWPRVWLHENDFQVGRTSNFGVGLAAADPKYPNVYMLDVDGIPGGGTTNYFRKYAFTAPVLHAPIAYEKVYGGCPEFQFDLDKEATEFQFTLRTGSVTLFDQRIPAPIRNFDDVIDRIFWTFPTAIGDVTSNGSLFDYGQTYTWTVTAYGPSIPAGSATSVGTFVVPSIAEAQASGRVGTINFTVSYPQGWAYKNGQAPALRVKACSSASFNGEPDSAVYLSGACTSAISGLSPDRSYYLIAYVDQNGNGVRDIFEPYGYYRDPTAASPFMPVAVPAVISVDSPIYEIVLRDPDTDNDGIPDPIEYALYGNLTSSGLTDADVATRFATYTTVMRLFSSPAVTDSVGDADGDGVNDLSEIIAGLAVDKADSSGDGLRDGDSLALFGTIQAASTIQSLVVTGVEMTDSEIQIRWSWEGPATEKLDLATATTARTVTYAVEGCTSLLEQNWATIEEFTADLLQGEAVIDTDVLTKDATARFFRIVFKQVNE